MKLKRHEFQAYLDWSACLKQDKKSFIQIENSPIEKQAELK